jgi:hypothetical protein
MISHSVSEMRGVFFMLIPYAYNCNL